MEVIRSKHRTEITAKDAKGNVLFFTQTPEYWTMEQVKEECEHWKVTGKVEVVLTSTMEVEL